jgi:hypothetical protein
MIALPVSGLVSWMESLTEVRSMARENRRLAAESRARIAWARRRLNPAWELCGASDLPPHELAQLVAEKISSGALFVLTDAKSWAGPATGKQCAVCDEKIFSGAECEVRGPSESVFAHLVCHSVWYQRSLTFSEEGSSAAG